MYVVDAADKSRMEESTQELKTIMTDDRVSKIPVLIVANKQVSPVNLWSVFLTPAPLIIISLIESQSYHEFDKYLTRQTTEYVNKEDPNVIAMLIAIWMFT